MSIFNRLFGKARQAKGSRKRVSATEAFSQNATEYYNKGVQYMHNDKWGTALDYLLKAAELNPEYAPCWYALGLTYGKIIPNDTDEVELRNVTQKMCSSFEKSVDLSDTHGGLEQQHYRTACISSGTIYRVEKQYDNAINLFKKGLVKVPDDTDLLESLALCFIEKGDLDIAEKTVEELLKFLPHSDRGRKLWKKVRKGLGKPLTGDMPEEQRKKIYGNYMSIQDNEFLLKSDILDDIKKADTPGDMMQTFKKTSERSKENAEKKVLSSYNITPFELQLILKEGKRKAWPVSSFLNLSRHRQQPPREQFRDTLRCNHCGKRNVAPFWPEGGDMTAFYFQSEEKTQEQPGEFRLPIECPFCNQTWYVVWDTSPDPLAGQFIRHIERMCEVHASNKQAVKAFRGMIDDGILGEHVKFIKKELKNMEIPRQNAEHSVSVDDYFSTLTVVPASDPLKIRNFLGGSYFEYMENILASADMNLRNTVHWIFAIDDVNVGVHMLFLPIKSELSLLPSIVPVDLLTQQERAQVGL